MAKCAHTFALCLTPPASSRQWYRCAKCNVFAWKRRNAFKIYKCTETGGCSRPATDRLPGLGGRGFHWRCDEHGSKAIDPDSQSPS